MLVAHLAINAVRLDEAHLQPVAGISEADKHCSGTVSTTP
jgi:hypothetical protein